MDQIKTDLTALDKATYYLQDFAASGRMVQDPVTSLREELNDPLERDMPVAKLKSVLEDAKALYEYWGDNDELTAEQFLGVLLSHDRPMARDSWDLRHSEAYELSRKRLCNQFLRFEFHKYPHAYVSFGIERSTSMARPEKVLSEFDKVFLRTIVVTNPLVALRSHEERAGKEYDPACNRAELLATFESLSRRLWHMATTVETNALRTRLLLQPHNGADDLALLERHRDLLGIPKPADDRPRPLSFDGGLDDLKLF